MEPIFENRYTMSIDRYRQWMKRPIKRNHFNVVWSIFGTLTLAFAIYYFSIGETGFSLYFFVLTAFCIYRIFIRKWIILNKQFKAVAYIHGGTEWVRTIRIGDEIVADDGNSTSTFTWDKITGVVVNDAYITLVFGKFGAVSLDKSGFSIGDADGFIDYMKAQHSQIPIEEREQVLAING